MNELFRFMVVRSPKQRTENPQKRMLPLFQGLSPDNIQHFERYHANHGKDMVSNVADTFFNSNEFIKDWSQLHQNRRLVLNAIKALSEPISTDQIQQILSTHFNETVTDYLKGANYGEEKVQVIESLVVAMLLGEKTADFKESLLQLFQLLSAVEKIVLSNTNASFQELMQRVLILPKEIFPKPTNEAYLSKKRELREAALKAEEEKRADIEKIDQEIEEHKEAIDEMILLYKDELREGESTTNTNPTQTTSPEIVRAFTPSSNIFDKLKKLNQAIVKKNTGKAKSMNFTELIGKMESNIKSLVKEKEVLAKSNPSKGLVVQGYFVDYGTMGDCAEATTPTFSPFPEFPITLPKLVPVIGDLFKVRQDLVRYEKGEIAHIENVMKGESKVKKHRRFTKIDETNIEETETVNETEKDLQTHDQYELQSETNRTISNDKSSDAGMTISASYGPVESTADRNTSSASSSQSDSRTSSNYARDVTSRSVQKLKERVFKKRSVTKIEEYEIINEHSIDNSAPDAQHVRGLYHWVNKIYKVQVVNYGSRAMLEFVIPEPAAFYRFAMTFQPQEGKQFKKPPTPGYCKNGVFSKLQVSDISEYNYLKWAGMYNVGDLESPPKRLITVFANKSIQLNESGGNPATISENETSLKIPKGFSFLKGHYKLSWGRGSSAALNNDAKGEIGLSVQVGMKKALQLWGTEYGGDDNWLDDKFFGSSGEALSVGDIAEISGAAIWSDSTNNDIAIPISISGFCSLSLSINIVVSALCERTIDVYEQWQLDTFHKIINAYNEQLSQYHREIEVRAFNASMEIQGRNPFVNREVEKIELKKLCIAQMTGQQFESFNSVQAGATSVDFPEINLKESEKEGKIVRFFENAFEWHNMTYLFYPYFWSNRNHWIDLLQIQDKDPLFERFLQAGSARVQVPVRPDFEDTLFTYLNSTEAELKNKAPWSEDGDPEYYLSMLDDLLAQKGVDFEMNTAGTVSVQTASKQVAGNGTSFDPEKDIDREIIIQTQSYRIASVESSTAITLREPFEGETMEGIGYYLGPKFVGEAWEELVPTELVYLSNKDDF
ncbi:MAG: hypothetical protein H6573_20565 [Lewinellaceae bacterium]|nr:hypothetical protein [Lewinellaceae bacterium]